MNGRLAFALRVTAIAVVAICLWFFVRSVDWSKLRAALADARLWPLAVAAVVNFAILFCKAVCWRIMLAPRYPVSTLRLFRYTIAAFAASVIAPARAGEVLRLWALKRRDGVPISQGAAVAVGEKLLDGVSLLMIAAPLPWLLPGLPAWVGDSIAICAGIALSVFFAVYVAVGRVHPEATGWLSRFIAGLEVVRSPRRLALSLLALMVSWLADLVMINLVLYAVGIALPVASGLLILFVLNLAIAVPSTPGQAGALEVGALAATRLLGVPDEPALAFALIYHVIQIVPLIAVGMSLELRMVLGREPPPIEATEASA